MDDLTSDRPGTRFGPRAIRAAGCPPGPHLEARVDGLAELRVVDFGDAPVVPADPVGNHAAIERTVAQVVAAGPSPSSSAATIPSRSPTSGLSPPCTAPSRSCTSTPTPTRARRSSASRSRTGRRCTGSCATATCDGHGYVQIGLRGYWPGEKELTWQAEQGITSFFMHDVRERGIREIVEETVAIVGERPVFLSVDVDVLDPAFAPGTGTPEPGGMTSADLLWACREVASRTRIVGMDVVEVIPTAVASADITALVAERVVREALTGMAVRRLRAQ